MSEVVSKNFSGINANGHSLEPHFSPDGTKIVFTSSATNLVDGDTNTKTDIFVKDMISGEVSLISKDLSGIQGNGNSQSAQFSPDGTKIAFTSLSSNFSSGDLNLIQDIFVKNLITGDLTIVSADINGISLYDYFGYSGNFSWSPDSAQIVFESTVNTFVPGGSPEDVSLEGPNVFLKNIETGEVTLVTPFSMWSSTPVFSPDGTKIAFDHGGNDVLLLADTNDARDVFLKDIASGTFSIVSTDSSGNQVEGPTAKPLSIAFSPDGKLVAFTSWAEGFVPNDTNNKQDIFIKNLETGETKALSTNSLGVLGDGNSDKPVFSPDGTHVAFVSNSNNLTSSNSFGTQELYLKDIKNGDIFRVADFVDSVFSFSPDGKSIAANIGSQVVLIPISHLLPQIIEGSDEAEFLQGGLSHDKIYGKDGSDIIYGYTGDDELCGQGGGDTLKGHQGKDRLFGQEGEDFLWGGDDDDTLNGGTDSDWMKGGIGKDTFVFDNLEGVDTVADFRSNEKIDLTTLLGRSIGFLPDQAFTKGYIRLEQNNSDAKLHIDLDGSEGADPEQLLAILLGVQADTIGQGNFILPEYSNIPPSAKDDVFSMLEDTILSGNVLADHGHGPDSDPNGDVLHVLAQTFTTSRGGTVVLSESGDFTYTPKADFYGTDSFTYKLLDESGAHDFATVSIRVNDVADFYIGTDEGDRYIGGYQNDTLIGLRGDDVLFGGSGWDKLYGNEGADTLYGGKGSDRLNGGGDADLFVLDGINFNRPDTILDLSISEGDRIQIKDILNFDPLTDAITDFVQITQSGADSLLSVDINGTDGGASFEVAARIKGVTGLDVNQLFADGDLMISNIIV
ncbi:MAG: PD40 domain-containing protein [Alphaproteobacteria bacterium]|nr:PD40 domain-containing protein [Alphaproteobacteria bacterium]QQS56014.1 MAG: PD40 domain-containing protein [Alphaproteobacteria bacterium]